jgi:DNA end-binding protein Ku
MDSIYLESSYYIQPEEAGEKPYTLLYEALRRSGYVGVAKVTMHQREHTVIIRPGRHGLVLHKMYYQDEIRATDEFRTNVDLVKDKELIMAQSLIDALAAPFEPAKFKDNYRETLRAMIDAKIAGEEVVAAPQGEEIAPVVDIMEALRSSLEALKKPATVTEMPKPEEKRRAGGAGRGR